MSSFSDYTAYLLADCPFLPHKTPSLFIPRDTITTSFHYHNSISFILITFSASQSYCFH